MPDPATPGPATSRRSSSASMRSRPRSRARPEASRVHRPGQPPASRNAGCRRTARASSPRRGADPAFRERLCRWPRRGASSSATTCRVITAISSCSRTRPTVQNVICCTLCSCTAFTIIGLPPDWYKDLEYRSRVVRESRTVLQEMGLDLPPRGRDPRLGHDGRHALHGAARCGRARPSAGRRRSWRQIVTRDGMIGVARL